MRRLTNVIGTIYPELLNGHDKVVDSKSHSKVIAYLLIVNNISSIIELSKDHFKKSNFRNLLNNNDKLFAFNNSVYDLAISEFRLAKPDEYVTVTCCHDYIELDDRLIVIRDGILATVGSMFSTQCEADNLLTNIA